MDLTDFLDKKCFLKVRTSEGAILFYTCIIKKVTDKHVFFVDRQGEKLCYLIDDIIMIRVKG